MFNPNMIRIYIIVYLFFIIIFIVLKSKRANDNDSDDEFSCVNRPIGVHFPHPTKCNVFYMCVGINHRLELNCSEGFEFDPNEKNCVPISDYGCTANQKQKRLIK
nr:hypothetical protein [Bombyx mori nucleopolyhedrovirus]WRK23249.1 hypothetical protein [Bombyx mori nucleopolyhedrovirus]WRK23663.1 hypothetical protein [Bombyx mori nucleopolyhedrovirus]